MKDDTLGAYNVADLREMARRRLPKGLFEFMDRGNDDEIAVRENRIALDRIKLKPRVLVDVSKRSQEISAQSPASAPRTCGIPRKLHRLNAHYWRRMF